jgi:soluble lytic murein transglycosylase
MRTHHLALAVSVLALTVVTCQRNAPAKPTRTTFEEAMGLSPLPTPSPTATSTPTLTRTPTATHTPIPTATPTVTPIPSHRLSAAHQAFAWGDYPRAQAEFTALLADSGADGGERQLATYWAGRSALEAGDYESALRLLQDFTQAYPDDPLVATAHLLVARAYENRGEWRRAMGAYRAYLQLDDVLAVYAYDSIGKAAMLILDYDEAVAAYADGLQVAPDDSRAVYMREGIAQAELARGDPAAAVEQYDAILSVARIDAYRARILYLAGQALMKGEDEGAAYERYAQAVNRYPTAHYAYLSLVELVNAGEPVDDYQRGLVDYHAGVYQPAIDAFTGAIEADPNVGAGDVHWYLALSQKANGNLWQAIQRFDELIQAYPAHEHVHQAWLEKAAAYAWRGDLDQALATYRTLARQYPQSPLAATALWQTAILLSDNDDLEAAAVAFRDMADRYPQDDGAPDALFKAALLDYRRPDFEAARAGWQALVETYPDSLAATAGRFWLGKAWLALENSEEADAAFRGASEWSPYSYHGLRAAEMLAGISSRVDHGTPLPPPNLDVSQDEAEEWLATWLPIADTTSTGTLNPAIAQDPAWRRGDALLRAGRRKEALEEWETVKEAWWDDPLAMYQLAVAFRDRGAYRLSIICAERLTWTSPTTERADVPRFIQQLSYPLYYRELVVAEAQAQDIEPLLLFTLIRQESLFEPSVTSSADARGLTQVIPPTGEWIAGRLGWDDWEEDDLRLPYVNVAFGAWYLSVQLATFDEQVIPALVAYNAGPGRVHEWLEAVPDLDLFVETMPYYEPRRYVRIIYGDYQNYQRLYRSEP